MFYYRHDIRTHTQNGTCVHWVLNISNLFWSLRSAAALVSSTGHSSWTGGGVVLLGGVGVVLGSAKGVVSLAGMGVILYSLQDIDHPEAGTGSDARRGAISATAEERGII